ncbi:hypothetical protein [Ramlibacter tataouinensis]|uniref:Uncharacterized protein n=1 Tax=Ramlibacter tataouinensis (strain ATCC BAA-407 / DSM 14655 / LMG 21543 / TTB310) TaxID=365046 RepID=F5Y4N9_RAMTT|nr:hypothetical protein [Ramlibacter tataouinensis]AEG91357.1 Hypothetical protein Rta_02913 [Ramlibacter tataouinensis TTB310]
MPIRWKHSSRFDPSVVLRKIDAARTVNPEGGASFSGFDWEECLPALHSMLQMPPAALEVDSSHLVWRALTQVRGALNPTNFLAATNSELSALLATREEQYRLLTTISVRRDHLPGSVSSQGASIRFLKTAFPSKFNARSQLIEKHPAGIRDTPAAYCPLIISLKAKSPTAAVNKALRAVDLQRALWCLMANPRMQISFGSTAMDPINVVRLGGYHTLHHQDGSPAGDGLWFEPGFVPSYALVFSKPAIVRKNTQWALRRLAVSKYKDELVSAMVRYARAFDEWDSNTAFIRLWSALESLVTPGFADYERLVRRCAFLFQEGDFHRQMLEHLREYRNDSVHSGELSDRARILCYQLQLYFGALIWFHLRNASFFLSLEEANRFLDSPADAGQIRRQLQLARKALGFLR